MQFYEIGEVPAIPHTDSIQSYHFTDRYLQTEIIITAWCCMIRMETACFRPSENIF